ncbi:hypothetical protein CC86DRAFT_81906 [Ophiobolus disseminans]|uniref:Heterokaryon incompatibility domain-containing protein n=1 Tax=Ophiobolus disseminans TaxID=1469910 RepID=A0A6A6ZQ32_9PLEO|nr:hypothetical protein CC86DRAFT_81906 [Ophiobolus disseminans]
MTSQSGLDAIARSMPSNSIYDNAPLVAGNIRLLDIPCGEWDDEIRCGMRTVSLADKPVYFTLSYTWGPTELKSTIYVNGLAHEIGPNLAQALRRIRAHHFVCPLCIWIDAICIDQANISEKDTQVPLMGEVYSESTGNLVWFGELDGSGPDCTMYFTDSSPAEAHPPDCRCQQTELEATIELIPSCSMADVASLAIPVLIRLATVETCNDFRACRLFRSTEEMLALKTFLNVLLGENPWFERIWVVQEVLRAPRNMCFIGHTAFPMSVLYDATGLVTAHSTKMCCLSSVEHIYTSGNFVFWRCTRLLNNLTRVQEQQTRNLFETRVQLAGYKATQDVDQIYGIFGITGDTFGITPNYGTPTEEVFIDASKKYLQALPLQQSFWIFTHTPLRVRYPSLPSWAIDWTRVATLSGMRALTVANMDLVYASLWERKDGELSCAQFHGDRMLLRGHYIDTINAIGDATVDSDDHQSKEAYASNVKRNYNTIQAWRGLVLAQHAPENTYSVPSGFAQPNHDWGIAWMRMLCAGLKDHPGEPRTFLTAKDHEHLLADAELDKGSLVPLKRGTAYVPISYQMRRKRVEPGMKDPELYQWNALVTLNLMQGKRMFFTKSNLLGFGNYLVEPRDEIWMPEGLTRLLVLRPANPQDDDMKLYKIVSTCYLEGCMTGLRKGVEVPSEEIGII